MFPIRWNFPFRKKDGSISTIGAEIEGGGGGGGYTLPTASAETKGGIKVGSSLKMIGEKLEKGDYIGDAYPVSSYRPLFKPSSTSGKYVTAVTDLPIDFNRSISFTPIFGSTDYSISDVYLPLNSDNFEYYNTVNAQLISDLSLVTLYDGTSGATSIELETPITNYSALVVQGCYNSGGTSSDYDTSIIYVSPEINKPYWFGMKDRNDSYGGYLTFSDATHGSVGSSNRTFKVYGVPAANRSRSRRK